MTARKIVRVETHTKTRTTGNERVTLRRPSGGETVTTTWATETETAEWALLSCGHWVKEDENQKKPLGAFKTMTCRQCDMETPEYVKKFGKRIFPTPSSGHWHPFNEKPAQPPANLT